MLICLFFWGRARPWLRVLLVGYVVAMASTLVYTGEHFVFDILLGWTYAVVTFVVGSYLLDRFAATGPADRLPGRTVPGHRGTASDGVGAGSSGPTVADPARTRRVLEPASSPRPDPGLIPGEAGRPGTGPAGSGEGSSVHEGVDPTRPPEGGGRHR